MVFGKNLGPDDVFTPRSAEINPKLYIQRIDLEEELTEALDETKHIVIFGESGNGKSWLYKKVFENLKVTTEVVNLAQASRLGSLDAALRDKIDRLGELRKEFYELKKRGKIAPGGVGAETEDLWKYELGKKEPYEDLLTYMQRRAKRKKKVLIFDNFEQVASDPQICKQVADCIILLDDPIYSQYGVKLCIVGVPSGIDEILASHGNIQTVSSRLREVPEVERMTHREARMLLKVGLEDLLRLRIDVDPDDFYRDVLWVTDRIAVELQEFGLRLAKEASKSRYGLIDDRVYRVALEKWTAHSLKTFCSAVRMRLNSKNTRVSRRNQCIYACGSIEKENFDYKDIEDLIREEFPETINGVKLNVSGELSKLSKDDNPILRKRPSDDTYRLSSPKYRMAIRALLKKENDGKIAIVPSAT